MRYIPEHLDMMTGLAQSLICHLRDSPLSFRRDSLRVRDLIPLPLLRFRR